MEKLGIYPGSEGRDKQACRHGEIDINSHSEKGVRTHIPGDQEKHRHKSRQEGSQTGNAGQRSAQLLDISL